MLTLLCFIVVFSFFIFVNVILALANILVNIILCFFVVFSLFYLKQSLFDDNNIVLYNKDIISY